MDELKKDLEDLVKKHSLGASCGIPQEIFVKMMLTTMGLYLNTMTEIKDYYDALDNEQAVAGE